MTRLEALVRRGRRALGLPPRHIAFRLYEEAVKSTRRPWSLVRPSTLTERRLLAKAGAASIDEWWERQLREPFFFDESQRDDIVAAFAQRFPTRIATIMARADQALRHEFDLLGSGAVTLGTPLPWHEDFKTGRRWRPQYWRTIEYDELDRPTDVKVPWELSRCQHFTTFGQAYWLTGDERYAEEFVAQVTDWLRSNPWARTVNWCCAMDVAMRAMSWIWGFYFMGRSRACASREFRVAFLKALYLHAEFIADNIERSDVNGNHYLTDGVGLVFLGVFFRRLAEGPRWLQAGRDIVVPEIFSQVTEDGVDFEMSTAYHRLVFEGFSSAYILMRAAGEVVPPEAWARLERMCEFVQAYVKPDGRIPFIGDADDGRMQQLGTQPINEHRYLLSTGAVLFGRADFKASAGDCWEETFWLLGPAALAAFDAVPSVPRPEESRAFPAGGYYVLRSSAAHVIVDCGEVGMRGRGGHGHNDILSFELFLNGLNVVTDCGSYLYTASREWRNAFRSTAYHNVVQVDDEECNRFVSANHLWTLQYDALPGDQQWLTTADVDAFAGSHTGYERLPGRVRTHRAIVLDRTRPRVIVSDRLEGGGEHKLQWRFHLDPAITAEPRGADVRLSADGREVWLLGLDRAAPITLEPGWVSPSYGVKLPTTIVSSVLATPLPCARRWLFSEAWLPDSERLAYVRSVMPQSFTYASDSSQ